METVMKLNIVRRILLIVAFVSLAGIVQAQETPRWSIINAASTHLYQSGSQGGEHAHRDYIPSITPKVIQTPFEVLVVNPNVRVHPSTVTDQFEVMIASNPVNRSHLFAAAHSLRGGFLNAGVYVSTDNGASWFGWDTLQATNLNDQRGDPAPIVDKNGNLLYAHLTSATNFGTVTGIGVNRSTNNGVSFEPTVSISGAGGSDADKELMGTDGIPTSQYYGRSYLAWTQFTAGGSPAEIFFSRTTDAGITWGNAQLVNTAGSTTFSQGTDVACGPNGEVYVCWAEESRTSPYPSQSIGFAKSTNGGTAWTFTNTAYATTGIRTFSFNDWNVRVNDFPRIAVDNTGGTHHGWIYIIEPEKDRTPAGSEADIVLHRSTDGGATWSGGIRVNQDQLNNGKVQFFPAICIDEDGGINVSYYDNRNFPSVGDSCDIFMSRSIDGGNTWTDIQITDHHFKPKNASGINSMGDYSGITAGDGKVFPFWMDDITGKYQAYTCAINVRPVIDITLDQKRQDGTRLTGTAVGRWGGSSFNSITITSLPPTINAAVGAREVLRGKQDLVTNPKEKYRVWERNLTAQLDTIQNHRGFTIRADDANLTSRFNPTDSGITIKTDLLDALSITGGDVQFRDPWFIDYQDPLYGNHWRNQGHPGALYTRSSPFNPDYTTEFDDGNTYKGVFLNQTFAGGVYYSVGAPQMNNIGGYESFFVNWAGGNVQFQNTNSQQTGVVFTNSGATAMAKYKGHLISSTEAATSGTTQRKLVRIPEGNHCYMVYTSAEEIWFVESADGVSWGDEFRVSDGAGGYSAPSIAIAPATVGYDLVVVYRRLIESNYEIVARLCNVGTWLAAERISDPMSIPQDVDPHPVIGYYVYEFQNDLIEKLFAAWEEPGGIQSREAIRNIAWEWHQQMYWLVQQEGAIRPTLSNTSDSYNLYYAYQYDGNIYGGQIGYGDLLVTDDPQFTNNRDCSIAVDNTARRHLSWIATYNEMDVVMHRSMEGQDWKLSPYYVIIDDFGGSSQKSSVCAHDDENNGGVSVFWTDGFNYVFDNYARDGYNFDGGTYSGYGNVLSEPNALAHALPNAAMFATTQSSSPVHLLTTGAHNIGFAPMANGPTGGSKSKYYRSIFLKDTTARNAQIHIQLGDIVLTRGSDTVQAQVPFKRFSKDAGREYLHSSCFRVQPQTKLNLRWEARGENLNHSVGLTLSVIDSASGNEVARLTKWSGASRSSIRVKRTINEILTTVNTAVYLKLSIEGLSSTVYKVTLANFEEIDRNVAPASPKETMAQVGSTVKSIPAVFALHQDYPNPFNPSTQIKYDLPEASHVTLAVYDVLGRKVTELVNGQVAEGYHTATWNAGDVASGIYLARFTATDASGNIKLNKVSKLILMK